MILENKIIRFNFHPYPLRVIAENDRFARLTSALLVKRNKVSTIDAVQTE